MQMKAWISLLTGGCAVLLAGCSRQAVTASSLEAAAFPVKVATVERRSVPVEIKAVGSVEPFSTISIKSRITGALDKVYFKEGDSVKEGDPLFDIDPRPYEEALQQAEANLLRDTSLLRQAEATLDRDQSAADFSGVQAGRARKLAEQGIFAREQLDTAESDLKSKTGLLRTDRAIIESARGALKVDEVAVSNAKLNLSYCHIVSPVAGRTGSVMLKRGNLIKMDDIELVAIHEINPIYVTFSVSEAHLPEIRRQMKNSKLRVTALIQDVPPDSAAGVVTFLDNSVDPSTGAIRLKATFDNAAGKLWPGQFVNVLVRLGDLPNADVVPPQAVLISQIGEYVYVVKSDNSVEQRPVTVSLRSESFVAIAKGVEPGEKVVVDGQVRLLPGSKVKVGP
jgi:membrane fusion protein, multidrug efflux system